MAISSLPVEPASSAPRPFAACHALAGYERLIVVAMLGDQPLFTSSTSRGRFLRFLSGSQTGSQRRQIPGRARQRSAAFALFIGLPGHGQRCLATVIS